MDPPPPIGPFEYQLTVDNDEFEDALRTKLATLLPEIQELIATSLCFFLPQTADEKRSILNRLETVCEANSWQFEVAQNLFPWPRFDAFPLVEGDPLIHPERPTDCKGVFYHEVKLDHNSFYRCFAGLALLDESIGISLCRRLKGLDRDTCVLRAFLMARDPISIDRYSEDIDRAFIRFLRRGVRLASLESGIEDEALAAALQKTGLTLASIQAEDDTCRVTEAHMVLCYLYFSDEASFAFSAYNIRFNDSGDAILIKNEAIVSNNAINDDPFIEFAGETNETCFKRQGCPLYYNVRGDGSCLYRCIAGMIILDDALCDAFLQSLVGTDDDTEIVRDFLENSADIKCYDHEVDGAFVRILRKGVKSECEKDHSGDDLVSLALEANGTTFDAIRAEADNAYGTLAHVTLCSLHFFVRPTFDSSKYEIIHNGRDDASGHFAIGIKDVKDAPELSDVDVSETESWFEVNEV